MNINNILLYFFLYRKKANVNVLKSVYHEIKQSIWNTDPVTDDS